MSQRASSSGRRRSSERLLSDITPVMLTAAAARAAILAGAAAGMLVLREGTWPLKDILEEVIAGPLSGRPLLVYLDTTLSSAASLLARPALRDVSLVLVDLSTPGGEWCERQTDEVLRAGRVVHLALLSQNSTAFFQDVAAAECGWRPMYLLLLDAWGGSPNILTEAAFSRVERLALLRTAGRSSVQAPAVIYSLFPFAHRAQVRQTGTWHNDTSLHHLFVDRFPSFEGYQFHLASWLDDYPYLYPVTGGEENEGDGLQVEVLDTLGRVLNFTYTLILEPPDWKWGELEDGVWTGMLGMIQSGEKNFTVNFFGYNLERIHAFDASSPYWMEGFGLTLLAPPPLPRWRAAYYPFQASVWACSGGTFLLVVLVWTLQGGSSGRNGRSWSYLLRPLLNHSLPGLPSSQGLRVFIAIWCLSAFILTIAYTANLIAFLSVPAFPPRIRTIEELAESSLRVSMCDYGEFVPDALKVSHNLYYRALGNKLDLFPEYNETVPAMISGTHAFLDSYTYSRILLSLMEYDVRTTYMLKDQLYPAHLCWYFRKNSPWKEKMDRGLGRVVEAGLIPQWLQEKTDQLLGRDWHSEEVESSKDSPLSLQHLQAPFMLLLILSSVSVVVLIAEILHHKLKYISGVKMVPST